MELPVRGADQSLPIQPTKIVALGLNYREHILESVTQGRNGGTPDEPDEPVLFPKTPNTVIGPGEPVVLPRILNRYNFNDERTDYEAELAIVIGRRCKNVSRDDAFDFVLGYTCANDVSQRNIQKGDRSGWYRGKSFDSFLPLGPELVPVSLIEDPNSLSIRCRKNGELVQDGNTGDMIFDCSTIVSFVSENFTLEPGDIILTGTPAGVGPIGPGDVVEVEIQGIGTLRNPVAAES